VEKINLAEKFALFADHWHPRIVAELNGQYVKLVKLTGEFIWHHHASEDELFLVVQGQLTIQFRSGDVQLGPGEMIVIPAGVEHRPVADEEVYVMLLEPKTTLNTGTERNERTVEQPEWI
jgi:mannose-6-phosphate isomerase-like protein (cupin superfamily)